MISFPKISATTKWQTLFKSFRASFLGYWCRGVLFTAGLFMAGLFAVGLAPKAQGQDMMASLKNQAFKVEAISQSELIFKPKALLLQKDSLVLIVRGEDGAVEPIARGRVTEAAAGKSRVEIDTSTLIKVPKPGDYIIGIALPWVPPPDPEGMIKQPDLQAEDAPPPQEPGYMQFDYGIIDGELDSTSTNQANSFKRSKFQFNQVHFVWYFQFISSLGIDYRSYSGAFPTSSYFRKQETTTQAISKLSLNYRFQRREVLNEKWRFALRLVSFTDEFTTSNTDEYVISSKHTATGMGGRLGREWQSVLWKPETRRLGFQFHSIHVDADYYPILSVVDAPLSRGTSAGSTGYEAEAGITMFVYIDYIPWFKRWVIDGAYGMRSYKLKFSGATTGEVGGPYTIPEGGAYSESVKYWRVHLGLRIDDFLGKLFMPR